MGPSRLRGHHQHHNKERDVIVPLYFGTVKLEHGELETVNEFDCRSVETSNKTLLVGHLITITSVHESLKGSYLVHLTDQHHLGHVCQVQVRATTFGTDVARQ